MAIRNDYKFLRLRDAHTCINQKVNIIGIILDVGLPKITKGTDLCCTLRIIDETHHQTGMTVNIFAENADSLPCVAAAGDVILLRHVLIKTHGPEVNAVYNKAFSSYALYKGKDDSDAVPYQVSSKFHPRDEDRMFIVNLRKWLLNFQLHEDSSDFPMLREIKEGYFNLACKILHFWEDAKDKWLILVWDGTDTPPNAISAKLQEDIDSPLPLQLEHMPLPRDLLCTLPTVGSILRISFDMVIDKRKLYILNIGKWVKFINISLKVHAGLWYGVFTPTTKLRYTRNEDCLIVERQRLYDERISLKSGRMLIGSLPQSIGSLTKCSQITEVNHDTVRHLTLMDVLTHSEVTAKFKCVVRVVAAMPYQAEKLFCSAGMYRMRLTLEDPTARIHAFVVAEDGEILFDGYPGIEMVRRKLNRLLGVTQCDGPRNPPWVSVCIKSYYVSKTDVWDSRHFRIFDTKIVGDA